MTDAHIEPRSELSTVSMHQQWMSCEDGDAQRTRLPYPNGNSTSANTISNTISAAGRSGPDTAPPLSHGQANSGFQVATGRTSLHSIAGDQAESLPRTNRDAWASRSFRRRGTSHTASSRATVSQNILFPPEANLLSINNSLDNAPNSNWQQNASVSFAFIAGSSYPQSPYSLHRNTEIPAAQDFAQHDVYNFASSTVARNDSPYSSSVADSSRVMAEGSENMQTAASLEDPMVMSEGQPMSRKRSHSVMSDAHLAQNLAQNISAMTNGLAEQQQGHSQQENPYDQQPYPQAQQQPYPHEQQHPYPHDQPVQHHDQQQDHQQDQTLGQQSEQQQDHQANYQQDQRRSQSVASGDAGSQAGDYSPRGSRAFKRGDPPRNEANKYICNYADECVGITFDRKCEWSKHMDKHDRPYRCPHASCAKLQGFTYSGGLLRHEREVHGKHGGPKSALRCPFTECKRHTGKGFTRKENLNEHLRRVHNGKEPVDSESSALHQELTEVVAAAGAGAPQNDDTQASRLSETATAATEHDAFNLNSPNGLKRKRSFSGVGEQSFEDVEAMRRQLDHLHAENARNQEIIRQMTEEAAVRDERLRVAEEALARMQNGQQI